MSSCACGVLRQRSLEFGWHSRMSVLAMFSVDYLRLGRRLSFNPSCELIRDRSHTPDKPKRQSR
jgi:hypothetical protein